MPILNQVDTDVIEIPAFGRKWYIIGGVASMLFGLSPIYVFITDGAVSGSTWLVIFGACFFIFGFCATFLVSRTYIDRRARVFVSKFGFFTPSRERIKSIDPQAVRITIRRHRMGADEGGRPQNTLWLVQHGRDIKVATYSGLLAEIRQMAEELATFLGVEYYEDKLYRSLGAFTPQSGPGTNPTRTYPATGEVVELDINEREEFGIEEEFLHEFHERYEDGSREREEREAAQFARR